jgi:ring-1,2-phenylacetyl-CoA epoxidase subunit PaaE
MMRIVEQSLKEHEQPKDNIRFELFASGQPGRAKRPAQSFGHADQGVPARVTLGGETRSFNMKRDTSLLTAALDNALDAPFACKAGVCSTCKAKVLEGEVEMVANHALEDYEVEAGYVLSCQCYPVSDIIVWDYDQAGH